MELNINYKLYISLLFLIVPGILHAYNSNNIDSIIIPQVYTDIKYNNTITYQNDLIIRNSETVVIENCNCEINGRIILSDNSTLILNNTKIKLIQSKESNKNINWFNISGNSNLIAINVTIETVFFQKFGINISNKAEALFDNVYSLEWYSLTCEDNTKVKIYNSTCWSLIKTKGNSILDVRDSRIYGVELSDKSNSVLINVESTLASVSDSGSLTIFNSTISSDTEGIKIIFNEDNILSLKNLPTVKTGLDYEFCEKWSLKDNNEIKKLSLSVLLENVYFKIIQFYAPKYSKINIIELYNPTINIISYQEKFEVKNALLRNIELDEECILYANSIELESLKALKSSIAFINNSKVDSVNLKNKSIINLMTSEISSVVNKDNSIIIISNSSYPRKITVFNNAILLYSNKTILFKDIEYNHEDNILNLKIYSDIKDQIKITMIINRNRIRDKKKLKISIDGDKKIPDIQDKKDIKIISFSVSSLDRELSIRLGPEPPEYVPFYLTLIGQQLISLFIIIVLIVSVILAWR